MAKRVKRTPTDPAFLDAVSNALQAYKSTRGEGYSNASLAADLGLDESTVANYIRRECPIMAEALIRACVDLGISFIYKGYTVSASSFGSLPVIAAQPAPAQLEFVFDAGFSEEGNSWRRTLRRADPMEFTLRIKIAG